MIILMPSKKWSENMLGCLNGEHELFQLRHVFTNGEIIALEIVHEIYIMMLHNISYTTCMSINMTLSTDETGPTNKDRYFANHRNQLFFIDSLENCKYNLMLIISSSWLFVIFIIWYAISL